MQSWHNDLLARITTRTFKNLKNIRTDSDAKSAFSMASDQLDNCWVIPLHVGYSKQLVQLWWLQRSGQLVHSSICSWLDYTLRGMETTIQKLIFLPFCKEFSVPKNFLWSREGRIHALSAESACASWNNLSKLPIAKNVQMVLLSIATEMYAFLDLLVVSVGTL